MIKDIEKMKLGQTASLSDAMLVVDQGGGEIALVVDQNDCLIGTITDGDIRRALIRGQKMSSLVKDFMNLNCRTLPENATDKEALTLMKRELLAQIPLVDTQKNVKSLVLLKDLMHTEKFENTIVIMAGGEGKRLRPHTDDCPKPMLEISGKPILEIILQNCISAGFSTFFFTVNYLKGQIKDYFKNGENWGVKIEYIEEPYSLGTAGSLSMLKNPSGLPVIVMNGDVLTRINIANLLKFHQRNNAMGTICVREHSVQIPYGVVKTEDSLLVGIEEKPVQRYNVNAGIYILSNSLIEMVPKSQSYDMPGLFFDALKRKHRISVFPIHEYWLDVGIPKTLEKARDDW